MDTRHPIKGSEIDAMQNDREEDLRKQAADRLMKHLLQKGRPAPYKERLIGGLANPVPGCMTGAVEAIPGRGPRGMLQRAAFAVEGFIKRISDKDRRKLPAGSKETLS